MDRHEIRAFEPHHVEGAARLLADRHRRQRLVEPALDPRFEDPATTVAEIEALLAMDGASGAVALDGGLMTGYLLGVRRPEASWGPNAWVEPAGHAVTEAATVRELYAIAATRWVDEGRTNHHVLVPAADASLVDAWFTLDFGQQHVHGIREPVPAGWEPSIRTGLLVRRAERADIPAMAEVDIVLPRHQARSPVFSPMPIPTVDEARAELEADFDDEHYTTFVAVHDGRVVGVAVGCSVEQSGMHVGLARPPSAGYLGFAAVLPEARGLGAGRALGETVLAWSRDAGFAWVIVDWRSTNLEASRAWTGLGFRPLFRRLHRTIA
jgi:ribosomal protein S18 acetylase RimI-like enzyme